MTMHQPTNFLLLLIISSTAFQKVHAICGAPTGGTTKCVGGAGCTKFALDCAEYTRMPYPTSQGQTTLAGPSPTYSSSTYAEWDKIIPSEEVILPYNFNRVTYVAIEPTELTLDRVFKAKQGSNVLHVRGTMQFITTFKLNGDVTINQAAGTVVSQQIGTTGYTMGGSTRGKGKLLNSLSGTTTSFEVHFPPDVTYIDTNTKPSIVAGTGLSNQQTYNPDSTGDIEFGASSGVFDADIEGSKIASVSERTIYKFTDYGRGTVTWPLDGTTFSCPPNTCTVKTNGVNANCTAAFQDKDTCELASGGNDDCIFNARSTRCSGSPSCTRNPEDLNEVTCTVPGPATTLMLIGPSNIEYTFEEYGPQSAPYNSDDPGCITDDAGTYASDAGCLALKGINLWPVVDPLAESQTPVLALTFLGNNNSYTKDNVENIRKITGVIQPVNTDDRYVSCGMTKKITGSIYITDLAAQTKGLYIGGCSASHITAIDPRTWNNNVKNNLITLNLDDTNFVNPPDISKLVNLERLSISGDIKNGVMTSLPDITLLTALKFFNISQQPGITTLPSGYFDTNILLEEIVMNGNSFAALPDDIFKYNVNLKVLDLGGNSITVASLKSSLLETNVKLTHFDLSDNSLVVNQANPLLTSLFEKNVKLSAVYLQDNNIAFLSHFQFQHNLLLSKLDMTGDQNEFRSLTTCPTNYYRTQIFMPSIESGQAVYYGCDLCAMTGSDAYSCWTDPLDSSTHHVPTLCPRGSYCDDTTFVQTKCAAGKYNSKPGQSSASSCINCFNGYYNPMEGQQTCPFQCSPGKYGNHGDGQEAGVVPSSESSCKDCEVGLYCAGQGTVVPTKCPAGRYGDGTAQVAVTGCKLCLKDTYSSATGLTSSSECTDCLTGKYSIAGSTTKQSCTGTSFSCKDPNKDGHRAIIPLDGSAPFCEKCPIGQFGNDGTKCSLCPIGYFGNSVGAKTCASCNMELGCGIVPGASIKVVSTTVPQWVADVSAGNSGVVASNSSNDDRIKVEELPIGIQQEEKKVVLSFNYLLQVSLYPPLLIVCTALLIFHRWFSDSCCKVDEFAGDHIIQDTHAIRKVHSRLGGAFTWMLICILIVVVTNSILERGKIITLSDTAERKSTMQEYQTLAQDSGEAGFGKLHLELEAYAMLSETELFKKCQDIKLVNATILNDLLTCSITQIMKTTCNVTLMCETTFKLRGDFALTFDIPTEFQTLAWTVKASTWEFFEPGSGRGLNDWIRYATTVNATAVAPKGHLLSGTAKDPTQASFGLTRGFADGSKVPHNKTSSGLQLSFTKTSIASVPMVEFYDLSHFVEFKFDVLPALHVETITEKLTTIQLLASIFSLLGAATKVLKFCKKRIAKKIDTELLKRENVPHDVKRRTELLHEDNLMHRRFKKLMSHHGIETNTKNTMLSSQRDSVGIEYSAGLMSVPIEGEDQSHRAVRKEKRATGLDAIVSRRRYSQTFAAADGGDDSNKIEIELSELRPSTLPVVGEKKNENESIEVLTVQTETTQDIDTVAISLDDEVDDTVVPELVTKEMYAERLEDLEKENDDLLSTQKDLLSTQRDLLSTQEKLVERLNQLEANLKMMTKKQSEANIKEGDFATQLFQ